MFSDMATTARIPLEIGFSDISIGGYSVGIAPTRTCEQIVEAYLTLITLVRRDIPDYLRDEDIVTLAAETQFDVGVLRNRVTKHLSALNLTA